MADLLVVIRICPTGSLWCNNISLCKGHIDDHRVLFEFGRKGIDRSIAFEWLHLHREDLIFVESHVVVHHVAVLQVDKQGHNDQCGRDNKLNPDQDVA